MTAKQELRSSILEIGELLRRSEMSIPQAQDFTLEIRELQDAVRDLKSQSEQVKAADLTASLITHVETLSDRVTRTEEALELTLSDRRSSAGRASNMPSSSDILSSFSALLSYPEFRFRFSEDYSVFYSDLSDSELSSASFATSVLRRTFEHSPQVATAQRGTRETHAKPTLLCLVALANARSYWASKALTSPLGTISRAER